MNPHILTTIFNMSIEASILVCIICIFRLIFRKAPKWITCAIWGLAGLKLMIPFSFESIIGLLPAKNAVSLTSDGTKLVFSNNQVQQVVDNAAATVVSNFAPTAVENSSFSGQIMLSLLCSVWSVGFAAMIIFAIISYVRIYVKTKASFNINGYNICDNINTPFILGIIKPKIFIPSDFDDTKLEPIVAHEMAHIKRKDHWWKPLGYLILSVYWFNPVIWVAYILLCRDIELACDEKVIRNMTKEEKADYSQILLDCSKQTKMITVCPVAFGETGVKQRIKSALSYKKPALWIIIAAIIASIAVAVCFTFNRKDKSAEQSNNVLLSGVQVMATDNEGKLHCFIANRSGEITEVPVTEPFGSYNGLDAAPDCFAFQSVNAEKDKLTVNKIAFVSLSGEMIDREITADEKALFTAVANTVDKRFDKFSLFETHNGDALYLIALRRGTQTEIYRFNPVEKTLESLFVLTGYDVQDVTVFVPDDGDIVYNAVMETYCRGDRLGECKTAAYVILDTKENQIEKKIYALVSFGSFGFSNGCFMEESGGNNPAVITVDKKTGEWTLKAPRDGSLYSKDIKKLFPGKLAYKASNPTEKQRKQMWEQMKSQAQSYLDSIGRSAEICSYSEIDHILLSDLGISTEVDNRIDEMRLPYNQEIGNYERIEDGVRYVYQTDYDGKNKLIKFTKFEYNTDNIAEYIEINAETGDIISGAAYPSKAPETPFQFFVKSKEGHEYSTVSYGLTGNSPDKEENGMTGRDDVKLVGIVDLTEVNNITTDTALEEFYSDSDYTYYFPTIRSKYIECQFSDGSKMTITESLSKGKVSISDLDTYGVMYWIVDKDGNYINSLDR